MKVPLPISYTAHDLALHAEAERLEMQEGHY